VKSAGPLLAILLVPLVVIGWAIVSGLPAPSAQELFTYGAVGYAAGTAITTAAAAYRRPDLSKGIDEQAITLYGVLIGASIAFGLGVLTFALARWPGIGLAVAAAGAAWFALWLPPGFRTMTSECGVVINRDVPAVFALLGDPRKVVEWDPRYEAIELLTPEAIGPGTRFRGRGRLADGKPFSGVEQVIDFESDLRVSSSVVGGMRNLEVVTFQADGGGTRVTRKYLVEFPLWIALLGVAFFKSSVARESVTSQEAAWARAKQRLEGQEVPA
jgi:polyketide cyclase/dehydrase/lipid transport protein